MVEKVARARGDESRAEIVAVAIDCFAHHGYQGTSIDRIARAAGLTKGALYYHFKDKHDLLIGAVDEQIGGYERHVLERLEGATGPDAVLETIVERCFELATKSLRRRFILTLMVESLDRYPDLSDRFRTMMKRFRDFIARTIAAGQRSGIYRDDLDPARVSRVFVGSIFGAETQYYQDPDAIPLREAFDDVLDQTRTWLAPPSRARAPRTKRTKA